MARKKKHPEHANHERWLVSYADFITLLFAFFVVMFASSQSDKGKAQQVSESVRRALEEGQFASVISGILGGTPDQKGSGNAMMKGPGGTKRQAKETQDHQAAELRPSMEFLALELKHEIETGQMKLELEKRGLVVSLQQAAFFPSGEDSIDPSKFASIEKVAQAMRKLPNPVRLEGHTDSVPIHNSRFRSNWELSAARSIAMLELLAGRFEIARDRMAIAGYAETAPVDTNDSEIGRARNRRVDIVILSEMGLTGEPRKPSPASVASNGR
jgi:chemotaxis protein MotB